MIKQYLVALCILASPTIAHSQDDEKAKTAYVAMNYKRCLATLFTDENKKTYTKDEMESYCGCWSVKIVDRVPAKEAAAATAAGTWQTLPALMEVTDYCRTKYMNLPDVTAIRNKQW
jgi:hypothetical protein